MENIIQFKKEPEMQEFDLTDEHVAEMKKYNSRLVALKNLIKEFGSDDSQEAFTKTVDELAKTQELYDGWFAARQEEFKVTTRPEQRWNVDFDNKKLQLIG